MRNTADMTDGKPIAVCLQSQEGGSTVNPLVASYAIHGRKGEVLFFCSVPDTIREKNNKQLNKNEILKVYKEDES
jgi:hypothetical protein